MPFDESLKLRVKQRAGFQCCICHAVYVEVHHVIPEAAGGPDIQAILLRQINDFPRETFAPGSSIFLLASTGFTSGASDAGPDPLGI
jgi:hypothetical protein